MTQPDDPRFSFQCPKQWSELDKTSDPSTRHCDQCNESVTLATTPEEQHSLAKDGRCAAVPCKESDVHSGKKIDWMKLDIPTHAGRLISPSSDNDELEAAEPEPERQGVSLRLRRWLGRLFR